MVILVVKGTKVPDEFVVEVPCTAQCGETAQKLCDIQNARLRVRLQLYSAADLCKELKARESELDASSQATLLEYSKLQSEVYAAMRNPKLVVREKEYEGHWTRMRDLTVTLFPQLCTCPEGPQAAIDRLYQMHDDPEIGEDLRLRVYHCRSILDPLNHAHECLDRNLVTMWFAGKEMAPQHPIGNYCGNNEKSRLTVKLTKHGDDPPSKEPRIAYGDQRDLHDHMARKGEELKTLETSELKDLVAKQRKKELLASMQPPPGRSGGEPSITLHARKNIFSGASEKTEDA